MDHTTRITTSALWLQLQHLLTKSVKELLKHANKVSKSYTSVTNDTCSTQQTQETANKRMPQDMPNADIPRGVPPGTTLHS